MANLKDGIYQSANAMYFIKEGKIIMNLNGTYYKTNAGFMQGTFKKDLTEGIKNSFAEAYASCKSW